MWPCAVWSTSETTVDEVRVRLDSVAMALSEDIKWQLVEVDYAKRRRGYDELFQKVEKASEEMDCALSLYPALYASTVHDLASWV